jgi:hypothetical protein
MKRQGTNNRDEGSGNREQGALERLLREALQPITDEAELSHDLWPAMLGKLRAEAAPAPAKVRVPWFDWALAGGLALLLAAFPAAIPVLLYYL